MRHRHYHLRAHRSRLIGREMSTPPTLQWSVAHFTFLYSAWEGYEKRFRHTRSTARITCFRLQVIWYGIYLWLWVALVDDCAFLVLLFLSCVIMDCHVTLCILFPKLSRLEYALPARGPFMTQELLDKIDAFLKQSHRYGFVKWLTKIQPLHDSAMENLFSKISLLITVFVPSSHQTDLSPLYVGAEDMILSCRMFT